MGATKGPYEAEFPVGTLVRIAQAASLESFQRDWKYHHPLQSEQITYAGTQAKVVGVGFYHGGEELYELDGIPGIWHECCLRLAEEDRRMRAAQPRELPWSWERSLGWRGQYDRLQRWQARLLNAGPDDLDLLFDLVLAYFTACYHLRDWLLRDDPGMEADLDRLFAKPAPLRLSADIANIAKHFDLTNPPRTERQLSFAREYVVGGPGWFGPESRLVVLSRGEKVDVRDLIQSCESAWAEFLREQASAEGEAAGS